MSKDIFEIINPTNTLGVCRPLAHILGACETIVYNALLSKYRYYQKNDMLDDGWFYSTIPDLFESTSFSAFRQKRCITTLESFGLIETKKGVFDRLQNMGSAVTRSDGAVSFSGEILCERRLDIVIGLPASGKSSALVEPISEMYKSRVIDSDEAKKLLPEYNDGWGAGVVHKESQRISEQQLITALEKGENITYPRVGGDTTELINIAAIAKSKGYSVYVHFNELDRNKALGRMINRFLETGRYIKPELITRYGKEYSMNTKTENNNSANNSVFLDNLFTLCSRRKVEAKDALNGAGINSGYIERWQNGEAVTYEMLGLLSIYFHIPVDYFFELSVNEKLLGNSVERTPNKPFEFLYETLLALCGDKRAKTEYKQIVVMSFIDFTITPYDVEQLLLASQNKKDFTPSQKLAAYYILSLVYKPAIPKGLVDEYEKEIELLNKMGCKDIVSWLNPLTDFRFDNNHIRKTIRCVIDAADIKNRWISFIRFHEHNVREISDLCVADYIEFYCPAVNNILNHLKIHYQTVDNEDWDELINGLFGVDATVYGVCQKHNISVS